MKKSTLIKLFSLLFAVAMILSLISCGTTTVVVVDDSDDSEVSQEESTGEEDPDEDDSDDEDSDDNDDSSSDKKTTTKKTKSKVTTKKSKTATKSTAKKTDLSRDEVMKSIPASMKKATIRYMYWNDPMAQMDGEAIEGFKKATGLKFVFIKGSYDNFTTEVATRIASEKVEDIPNVIRLLGPVSWQLTNLQPVSNTGYNFNDKAWDEDLMHTYTFNGSCYALNLKKSAISDVMVVYYNKTALANAEMSEDPYTIWAKDPSKWTWDKFWAMCKEFKDGYARAAAGATFEYGDTYARAMDGSLGYYDPDQGLFVSGLKNANTRAAWKKTLQMEKEGLLLSRHDIDLFDSGRVLFFLSGPFSARAKDSRQATMKKTNRLGVVVLPTDSKRSVMYEYTAFGIPKGAGDIEAVPYYLRYVLDQQSYDMDKVYCTKQARAVVDYACAMPDHFYGYLAVTGGSNMISAMREAGPAQVDTVLKDYVDALQATLDAENERISYWE